jgi:NADPH:quinone reductase-like Zn-dependent oxidoreductase
MLAGEGGEPVKAIIKIKSGPPEVLQLQEVERPTPGPDEVLIKIHAATVTRGDVVLRSMPDLMLLAMRLFIGMRRKKIPGTELAGEIEAVGEAVSQFSPGDPVFGTTGTSSAGSYAEYVCLPEESGLAIKPANLTFEEAAAIPVGGYTALYYLRPVEIQPGQKALVYGASGSVGTYAVQLAKHYGAEVTGVSSTSNLELVRSLGADQVIDYTKEDFAGGGESYDVIFDAVGKTSLEACRRALAPEGTFLTVRKGLAKGSPEDLNTLKELVEAGALRPVIDRRYPLEQAAEAHRYVETGHKVGNVVLTVRNG